MSAPRPVADPHDRGHYPFGDNWRKFLRRFDERRLDTACDSIRDFMDVKSLKGRSFVDLGCGSGLFSYAACRLGARRVVSIDVDPASVACARQLRERAGNPEHWQVMEGSVLDSQLVSELGKFDVVYSWGVLHHTGNMWRAIDRAASMTRRGGWLYISIYNRKRGLRGSSTWRRIKRFYNALPTAGQRMMDSLYFAYFLQSKLLRFKNPMRSLRQYQQKRGMDFITDVRDWLGGHPYEYASVQEIFSYMRERYPHCMLRNLNATDGLGTNWFLFQRLPENVLTDLSNQPLQDDAQHQTSPPGL